MPPKIDDGLTNAQRYRGRHREKINERRRGKYAKYNHRWYLSHKESNHRRTNGWRLENRDSSRRIQRISESKRRSKLAKAQGSHTWEQWCEVVRANGNKCLCCFRGGTARSLHRDHVVSINQGGGNSIENVQPLCKRCNSSKKNRSIDYRLDRWAPMFRPPATHN